MGSSSGGSGAAAKTVNKVGASATTKASDLTGGLAGQNLGKDYYSQLTGAANNLYNLGSTAGGYGMQAMSGANAGGAYGTKTAADTQAYSQSLFPYAQQIGQMGFDPQHALYDRTLHQVQEQSRAGQAARGLSMSPYGAGLEGDANRNFNIDWQNQQLKRATEAASAMEGLGSSAFNLGSGAADLAASAGRLPYDTQKGMYEDQANAISNLGGQVSNLNQPRQQTISDYLQAAGLGPSYTNAASQSQQASTNKISSLASIPLSLIGKH